LGEKRGFWVNGEEIVWCGLFVWSGNHRKRKKKEPNEKETVQHRKVYSLKNIFMALHFVLDS